MPDMRSLGQVSNKVRLVITDSTTGNGKTGLVYNTSGLVIATIADVEAVPTLYTTAGSTIETIATLGTFAAPTATKCRFKEVDSANHPGLYELQFADARFNVANAKSLVITISGVSGIQQVNYLIEFNSPVLATILPGQCVGTLWVLDITGTPVPGVEVTVQALASGSLDGYAYATTAATYTSDADGKVVLLLPAGGVQYQWKRGSGNYVKFTTPTNAGESFTIPSGLGTP